jgi:Tol biopolymer transport system component
LNGTDDLVPYQSIGSMLETMDRESGRREFLAGSTGCWEAPNWTHDGKSLVFNAGGLLYRFDLETLSSEILPTGFANRNNNDHVISFDGTQLAISHHSSDDNGQSVVYTIPAGGGIPERVTPLSPSYLHGWSPDNRYLVYTGGRNGIYNIYRIPFGVAKRFS